MLSQRLSLLLVLCLAFSVGAGQRPSTVRSTPYTRSLLYPPDDANDLRPLIKAGPINVKDYPYLAKGNGVTDDSAAFNAAISAAAIGQTIYVPKGVYKANVTHSKQVRWLGDGMSATFIKSYTADANVFTVTISDTTWQLQGVWQDMAIAGTGTWPYSTVDCNGVSVGNSSYLSGRLAFSRVYFMGLDKAVEKTHGNIGNTFETCVFQTCNYFIHAKSDPSMHAGNDYLYAKCHIAGANKAAFYYENTSSSGGVFIHDCIIESNPGFVFFVKDFYSGQMPGIVVTDTHFESNSNYGSTDVVIDGDTYTAAGTGAGTIVFGQFRNAAQVVFERCHVSEFVTSSNNLSYPTNIRLEGCTADASYAVTSDANSVVSFWDDCPVHLYAGMPASVVYSYSDKLLTSETFQFPVAITYIGTTTTVKGGMLFSTAQQFSQGVQYGLYGDATISAGGKWVYASVTAKWISGEAYCPLQCRTVDGTFLSTFTGYISDEWATYATITFAPATKSGVNLYTGPAASATVIQLAGYQLLEFDTYQEALEYHRSRQFSVQGVNHLLQTDHAIYYTFDVDDDASTDDYQFDDDQANQTEQVITLTDILPAYCDLESWQIRCFETVTSSTSMQIDFGTSSGGNEIGTGSPDTANDIIGIAAGGQPALAATNAARSLYFSGTPGANWDTLDAGRWILIMHVRRNDLVYIHKNP